MHKYALRGKRGDLLGLPLVFIFALVVGALILIWGGSVILDLGKEADCIDLYDSMKSFEATIDSFYNYDEGSSKQIRVSYPSSVEYVCFFNPEEEINCMLDGGECEPEGLWEGFDLVLESEETNNFFILPMSICEITRIEIRHLKAEQGNPLCISNRKSIRITTKEDYVGITYVGPE
ncbi:hypothetical protein HZB88_02905 [archaeon]|nr:hypothetical protein [archaeon]